MGWWKHLSCGTEDCCGKCATASKTGVDYGIDASVLHDNKHEEAQGETKAGMATTGSRTSKVVEENGDGPDPIII